MLLFCRVWTVGHCLVPLPSTVRRYIRKSRATTHEARELLSLQEIRLPRRSVLAHNGATLVALGARPGARPGPAKRRLRPEATGGSDGPSPPTASAPSHRSPCRDVARYCGLAYPDSPSRGL